MRHFYQKWTFKLSRSFERAQHSCHAQEFADTRVYSACLTVWKARFDQRAYWKNQSRIAGQHYLTFLIFRCFSLWNEKSHFKEQTQFDIGARLKILTIR